MDKELAEKYIGTMERAKSSKWKFFGFCSLGLLVGIYLYLNPYQKDLLPGVYERIVFVKCIAVFILVISGPLALFFLISLPTRIWERICDWQIKKIRDAVEEE